MVPSIGCGFNDVSRGSVRNKASRMTGHLVAISLTQGLLVHLCPDK